MSCVKTGFDRATGRAIQILPQAATLESVANRLRPLLVKTGLHGKYAFKSQ